jgi:hypothetical protein
MPGGEQPCAVMFCPFSACSVEGAASDMYVDIGKQLILPRPLIRIEFLQYKSRLVSRSAWNTAVEVKWLQSDIVTSWGLVAAFAIAATSVCDELMRLYGRGCWVRIDVYRTEQAIANVGKVVAMIPILRLFRGRCKVGWEYQLPCHSHQPSTDRGKTPPAE